MKSVWSDETGWIINEVDKICCCVLLTSFYLKKKILKKKLAVIGNWWYDIDSDNILNCPRSNYYFLTQLNQLLDNTTSKYLSMFHCNIRSLPKHLSLVNEFLHSVNRKPDILAFTETRLSDRTITNVDILNYDFFHTNPLKQTSGTGLYVWKNPNAIHGPDLKFAIPLDESSWWKVTSGNGRPNIIVGSFFRHPTCNLPAFTFEFQTLLKEAI